MLGHRWRQLSVAAALSLQAWILNILFILCSWYRRIKCGEGGVFKLRRMWFSTFILGYHPHLSYSRQTSCQVYSSVRQAIRYSYLPCISQEYVHLSVQLLGLLINNIFICNPAVRKIFICYTAVKCVHLLYSCQEYIHLLNSCQEYIYLLYSCQKYVHLLNSCQEYIYPLYSCQKYIHLLYSCQENIKLLYSCQENTYLFLFT